MVMRVRVFMSKWFGQGSEIFVWGCGREGVFVLGFSAALLSSHAGCMGGRHITQLV